MNQELVVDHAGHSVLPSSSSMLQQLALRAMHVLYEGDAGSLSLQSALAAAVRKSEADIVLAGKQAADTNSGSTAPGVAQMLGLPCVGLVSEVKAIDGNFVATRSTSSGMERVSVSGSCVFAFDRVMKSFVDRM